MDLNIHSPLPRRKDFRIGILGSGLIVNDCHLVAYRKAGFNPVAIASRNREHAARVAQRHNVPKVYDTCDQLLDDPTIEVLDIAVPPNAQLALIKAACARKTVKGILAQKPLAMNYAEALEAVAACEAAGISLAVNQNMRYDHSVRTAKTLLESGTLGEPILATIEMRGIPHWMDWHEDLGWLTLRIMSIHHLDTFRYWFGDPEGIYCSVRPDPRTKFPHTDGICTYILEYAKGLRCVGLDDTWTGPAKEGCPSDNYIRWRIEGLNGLAIGDIGWCKAPYTTPSTIRYAAKGDQHFHCPVWPESWFPDAFTGTMAQLLIALENNTEPAISGRDNLKTMALVDAAYQSAADSRLIEPSKVEKQLGNFTPRVAKVLALARQEATRFHHDFIGTGHLLLGLLALDTGLAVNVLRKQGLNLEALRTELENRVGDAAEQQLIGDIHYAPRAKQVLALAAKEAASLHHTYIGTEHLLLGILREDGGVAASVLASFGAKLDQTRREILKEIDPDLSA
jgi:predicted dehydrogenase